MEKFLLILTALAFVIIIVNILSGKYSLKNKRTYSYEKKVSIMTDVERKFFDVLVSAVGDKYYIFPQIHLSTLFGHKIVGQNWRGALSHINGKSVDFVLCDKLGVTPIVAIELDDRSHTREDRILRDEEVNEMFEKVGLPLLRVPNHGYFDRTEILRLIEEKLNSVRLA